MAQTNTGIIVPLFRKVKEGFQKVFITASNIMMADNKTTLQEKINDIDDDITTLNSNFIVEENKNSNGNYRKWSNGILEMWGKKALNNVNINNRPNTSTTVYNSIQYRITFPFASLSECIITCTNYSNTGAWVSLSTGGDRKSSFMFWLYCSPTSSGGSHYVCWRAMGTWK
ncbi:hypothetical protein H8S37_04775 [Mediterraneibacter sp. NSJ-55]|uniref:Uncharacterized protein n=1 Tax=Mediterraneibacter hominis TaxID=2763054 RepID=A0A923LGD1_9FIRM|nr:hypothetical protein [Mediterraneibacter hominis]MBC5688243.1 hypothetical protein [Mediterraneibacter hominis]